MHWMSASQAFSLVQKTVLHPERRLHLVGWIMWVQEQAVLLAQPLTILYLRDQENSEFIPLSCWLTLKHPSPLVAQEKLVE